MVRRLSLAACGCTFTIDCGDDQTAALVRAGFGGLETLTVPLTQRTAAPLRVDAFAGGFRVCGGAAGAEYFDDPCGLLFHLDKHFTIALQLRRSDLYFLHAAAVARNGLVAVIPGAAGIGKSTLTLALMERGFALLSDELAPVDVRTGTVHPYARALCLKSAPPPPYNLPPGTIEAEGQSYVPVSGLPSADPRNALPLAALIFLRRNGTAPRICRSITAARAAARLMANALNPLAHQGTGLDGAVTLGQMVPCFELDSANLDAAGAAVETILQNPTAPSSVRSVGVPGSPA